MALTQAKLSAEEETQLTQTIEMFEVITQGQPQDYQSLEILKEAYVKLGREDDLIRTSKRVAEAYVLMGQLSSAILEYESLLQHKPEDSEVQSSLRDLEVKARQLNSTQTSEDTTFEMAPASRRTVTCIDEGAKGMRKLFVDGKLISEQDFDACWKPTDSELPAQSITHPFIQILADKGILPVDRSLKAMMDKTRLGYIPLGRYDTDIEVARKFDAEFCRRWCVMPFDRMSKTVLVATANPFNHQATLELEQTKVAQRVLLYLATPNELMKAIRNCFR